MASDNNGQLESLLTGNAADLYQVWKKIHHASVWKNDDLADGAFLFNNGAFLTKNGVRIAYHGRANSPRIHIFVVRQSGTGKSETSKASHRLMGEIGLSGAYQLKATDAALLGTIVETNKEPKIIKGLLSYKDYLVWDEGTVLLKTSAYSDNLQDLMQLTMDEPGWVEKSLRLGTISYATNTCIYANAYIDDSINSTILKRGLFQRMLVDFRSVCQEEISDFCRNRYRLVDTSPDALKEYTEEYKQCLNRVKFDTEPISINKIAYEAVCEKVAHLGDEYAAANKQNDSHSKIIGSFISRSNQLLHVACIAAALNNKKTVGAEELDVGFAMWWKHVKSANAILSLKSSRLPDNDTVKVDLLKAALTKKPGGMTKTKLAEMLQNTHGWGMGKKYTLKFINQQVAAGTLVEVRGKGNEQIVRLA